MDERLQFVARRPVPSVAGGVRPNHLRESVAVVVMLGVEVNSFEELFVYGETPSELSRLPTGS
jgi:hypothetical protein